MRKKMMLLFALLLLLLGAVIGYADEFEISSLPGGGWWSATQVMNVGDTDATVAFVPIVAEELGTIMLPDADIAVLEIAPGASKTFLPGSFGNLVMDDGYKGSVLLQANQPVVAIGSIGNNLIGGDQPDPIGVTGGRAAAQFSGVGPQSTSTTLAFPVVKNDYKEKSTTFYIQTIEAGTVYATYRMNKGQATYETSLDTRLDGQMLTFSPSDAGVPMTCIDPDFSCLGAVTFTSTVPLAGIYVEHNTLDSPAQILLATKGFAPDQFSTTVVNPVVKSMWKGRTTGVQVQNVGNASSVVTVTLTQQDGVVAVPDGTFVRFDNVVPGSSVTFFPGNHGIFQGPLPADGMTIDDEYLGAAMITSDQPMVTIVNENDFAPADVSKQTVFAGFAQEVGTNTVLFPLVKEDYNGNQTGLQVANVGNDPVFLEAEYVLDTGTFTVDEFDGPIVIGPGQSFTFYGVTEYWTGFEEFRHGFGAVTITAVPAEGSDARIVGIAQEAERLPGGGLDYLDTKNYEGLNR